MRIHILFIILFTPINCMDHKRLSVREFFGITDTTIFNTIPAEIIHSIIELPLGKNKQWWLLQTTLHHDSFINSIDFSKQGTKTLTTSCDQTARIWNNKGKELMRLPHNGWVNSGYFNTSGSQIVTASTDNTARIWDSKSGQELQRYNHNTNVLGAVFNKQGTKIATACIDKNIRIIPLNTTTSTACFHHNKNEEPQKINSIQFNNTGTKLLAAPYNKTACIWDEKDKHSLAHNCPKMLIKSNHSISSACFNHKNTEILITTETGKHAYLFSSNKGKSIQRFPHKGAILSAVFNNGTNEVVTCSNDNTARIWKKDGTEQASFIYKNSVMLVAASKQGTRIGIYACAYKNPDQFIVQIWKRYDKATIDQIMLRKIFYWWLCVRRPTKSITTPLQFLKNVTNLFNLDGNSVAIIWNSFPPCLQHAIWDTMYNKIQQYGI